jgi:hypothetical protein
MPIKDVIDLLFAARESIDFTKVHSNCRELPCLLQ